MMLVTLPKVAVGIVGGGVVGKATARAWLEHVKEVRVHDLMPERRTHTLDEVAACDVVFVCVPEQDVPVVVKWLTPGPSAIVIKSTVAIGTTAKLVAECNNRVIHSPEFLTERCAIVDAQIPTRNIIGSLRDELSSQRTVAHYLDTLCTQRWPHVPVLHMRSDESEAIKLIQNAFFAAKVGLFNQFCWLCDELGLNWNRVLGAVLADGRVHPSHTQVPGHDGRWGFGGKCLQKDLINLLETFKSLGCPQEQNILSTVLSRNCWDRER